MEPKTFTGQTHVLGKPRNWNERYHGQCKGLPCFIKSGRIYSEWKISLSERFKILFGKPITVTVISGSMPPISLEVKEVFEKQKD